MFTSSNIKILTDEQLIDLHTHEQAEVHSLYRIDCPGLAGKHARVVKACEKELIKRGRALKKIQRENEGRSAMWQAVFGK